MPQPEAMDAWARLYVETQLFAQDASTSALDRLAARPAVQDVPTGMYLPTMLGHEDNGEFQYTGLLVLIMPRNDAAWLTTVTDPLSRSIVTVTTGHSQSEL